MRRTTRLFALIQLLRGAPRPLTAAMLARQLEVTKRTIYRDIASLQGNAVPIEGEAGVGYIMRPGYDLPPLTLTVEEAEAVEVALGLLRRSGDRGLKDAADSVRGKLAAVLPSGVCTVIGHGSLLTSSCGAAEPACVDLALVRRALREARKLILKYGDAHGCRTRRIVRPVAVVYYVDVITIAAWCELRCDFRHFRADRIVCCALHGETFAGEAARLRQLWSAARAVGRGADAPPRAPPSEPLR